MSTDPTDPRRPPRSSPEPGGWPFLDLWSARNHEHPSGGDAGAPPALPLNAFVELSLNSDATRSQPRRRGERSAVAQRLRDRKMARWILGYAAGAWLLLQVVDVLSEIWGWGLLSQQLISLALGLGLLPTVVVAWYHGEKGRQRVCPLEVTLLAVTLTTMASVLWIAYLSAGGHP